MIDHTDFASRHADCSGSAQPMEAATCETDITATPALVPEGSGKAVSPAISPAISPSTVENVQRTETDGDQSGNKSGSESVERPNCYECIYRRSLTYSAHSECMALDGKARVLAFALIASHGPSSVRGLKGNEHGHQHGWFHWPLDFDPIWIEECDYFKRED